MMHSLFWIQLALFMMRVGFYLDSLFVSTNLTTCIRDRYCNHIGPNVPSELLISHDNNCSLITFRTWSSITVLNNLCNDVVLSVPIEHNPYLVNITIGDYSFMNTPYLRIHGTIILFYRLDNPQLKSVVIGSHSFQETADLVISSILSLSVLTGSSFINCIYNQLWNLLWCQESYLW